MQKVFTKLQTTFQNKKITCLDQKSYFITISYTPKIRLNLILFKSSRSQMLYKIVVLENSAKFTGKQLSWGHFLINLHAKRDSITSVFLWFL